MWTDAMPSASDGPAARMESQSFMRLRACHSSAQLLIRLHGQAANSCDRHNVVRRSRLTSSARISLTTQMVARTHACRPWPTYPAALAAHCSPDAPPLPCRADSRLFIPRLHHRCTVSLGRRGTRRRTCASDASGSAATSHATRRASTAARPPPLRSAPRVRARAASPAHWFQGSDRGPADPRYSKSRARSAWCGVDAPASRRQARQAQKMVATDAAARSMKAVGRMPR
jgi:hypothetical protein